MFNVIEKLDALFCAYIGLDNQSVNLNLVKIHGKKLSITNSESYKRHYHTSEWKKFSLQTLPELNEAKKKSLGLAMGKAIAKKLFVSFEDVSIKNDSNEK